MSSRLAIAVAAVCMVLTAVPGCSTPDEPDSTSRAESSQSAKPQEVETETLVSGYPLDRRLPGLVAMRGVSRIVLLDSIQVGPATDIGFKDATDADSYVITEAEGTLVRTFRGVGAPDSRVRFIFGGGVVDGRVFDVGPEAAPDRDKLEDYPQLLMAGPMVDIENVGRVLDPWFVYGVAADGQAVSLLESASENFRPNFSLSELSSALRGS